MLRFNSTQTASIWCHRTANEKHYRQRKIQDGCQRIRNSFGNEQQTVQKSFQWPFFLKKVKTLTLHGNLTQAIFKTVQNYTAIVIEINLKCAHKSLLINLEENNNFEKNMAEDNRSNNVVNGAPYEVDEPVDDGNIYNG